jgi:hypothetical protein
MRSIFGCCAAMLMGAAVLSGDATAHYAAGAELAAADLGSGIETLIALDPSVFGSSAGSMTLKPAPATWSSRFEVRSNARWAGNGRYLT